MYSFDLKNVVPSEGLFAKSTIDKSNLWHRRLGHINFKTMNKLVKGNLVRGLPSKLFENDHTCVACQKGKQHKASCKTKLVSSISQPLQMLHMDLFGPTSIRSNVEKIGLAALFSWVFFLATFDGKADEGFFVGYSINSKAFRVFNTRTRKLLQGNQTNKNAGIKDIVDAIPTQQYICYHNSFSDSPQSLEDAVSDDVGKKTNEELANKGERNGQEKEGGASNKENDQNVQDFRAALDNLLFNRKKVMLTALTEIVLLVERLLAMTTPSPSPPISLSPPSARERLDLIDAVTTALPSPPLPPLPPSLYIPPPTDCRDDIPESEQPPRKRLYLSTLGSRYEVGESSTARPTRGWGMDYRFVSMVDAEERRQGIRDVGYGIRDTWVDPVEAVPEIALMTVG
ncbi:putative ribonuclease H-like domain-containing protein [Tanacetum coccineum]